MVFIAIALAFPILAVTQSISIKKIVFLIRDYYNSTIEENFEKMKTSVENENYLLNLYILTNLFKNTEATLCRKYMTHKLDKFFAILTSLITCLLHLTTLYNLII